MNERFVVLGGGGHARVVLDALERNGKVIVGLTDFGLPEGELCMGYPVLGTDDVLKSVYQDGVSCAAMGIGHVGAPLIRNKVYRNARDMGFLFPNVIHPNAVLAESAVCGEGSLFLAGCVVNAEAQIGNLCIINTLAVVEHEAVIENGVHIAPHATVLGRAYIGENSFIGAGSVILQGVHVGRDCIIGAGSIVLHDVPDGSVVVGNPGKILRRKSE